MKIKSAEFAVSAPDVRSCPDWTLPEFALIGRSNVGKSSLVNLLTERRNLAKVSDTPGKTQLINFYVVNKAWCLVDLPGYGYAAAAKSRRHEFNAAVAGYLADRPNLQRVFVLLDSRLPPQTIDLEFLRWLEEQEVPFALIFTKTDKRSEKGRATLATVTQALGQWRSDRPEAFASSVQSRAGRDDILGCIERSLAKDGRP